MTKQAQTSPNMRGGGGGQKCDRGGESEGIWGSPTKCRRKSTRIREKNCGASKASSLNPSD